MVSNISSCTKALVLLISLLGVSSFSLRAQEKDFATWANVGFEYKLKPAFRSEERRVGKECRSRWSPYH